MCTYVRCAIVASLLAAIGASAYGANVKLSVTPATSVLGVPPALIIEVGNPSSVPISVAKWFVLHVTPLDGRPEFFARVGPRHEVSVNTELTPLTATVPAGKTLLVEMPPGIGLRDPAWFLDERMSVVGVYRLSIALAEDVMTTGVRERELDDNGSTTAAMSKLDVAHVLSNQVTFTVSEPSGVDLEACKWLSARLEKSGCPVSAIGMQLDVAEDLVKRFPRSSYAPYFAAAHPGVGKELEGFAADLQRAIALVGDSPVADWYHWELARVYEERAVTDRETHPDVAAVNRRAAHEMYEYLKSKAHRQVFRDASADRLKRLEEDRIE